MLSKDVQAEQEHPFPEESSKHYPVPQQAEHELRLSDIERYRLTLFGLDQFNFKTLVGADLQVAAAGPRNPLLDNGVSELVSKTRQVIEVQQDRGDNGAQEREERKNFHKLFDQVINRVRINSDLAGIESHGNDAKP